MWWCDRICLLSGICIINVVLILCEIKLSPFLHSKAHIPKMTARPVHPFPTLLETIRSRGTYRTRFVDFLT